MNETTKLGLGLVGAALGLAVLSKLLLGGMGEWGRSPWGLNVLLWTVSLIATVLALARWRGVNLVGDGRWLIGPALFFAAAFAWRDSVTLRWLNGLALLLTLGLAVPLTRNGLIRVAGVLEYGIAVMLGAVETFLGPFIFLFNEEMQWGAIGRGGWTGRSLAGGRGLLLALPLLVIFGSLLAAADAAFASVIGRLWQWDPVVLVSWLAAIALWFWVILGYLYGLLLDRSITMPRSQSRPAIFSLGIIEIGIVLGLLDLLFSVFVLVQFRYFFGGADQMLTSGLTYSEYARRGFFELVTVTALVLPLLLITHWLLKKEQPAHEQIFRILAGTMIVLLTVVMVSALQRMQLYQAEYGLTQLRFYTTAFMGWLTLLFGWFVVTVLRGQRLRFAVGTLVSGFLVLVLLNSINPDAFIVRANAARVGQGKSFDVTYATSLSADAVPALIEVLPNLRPTERQLLVDKLIEADRLIEWSGWRSWNWSRAQARQSLEANHQVLLEQLARRQP